MHANKREEFDIVYSGDIAAAVGFKSTTTGDTICDEQHPVILESMEFPEPDIDVAIEPKTKGNQGKCLKHLQNWLKKILHSELIQIRKQDRQSSLVWVSFTLRSSLTVSFVSSK